jgi:GR25 family glycosyltransferase involved in LPS biosynthesis
VKDNKQFDIKIIYNYENPNSEKAANNCLNSFLANGYSGEMINGVWRDNHEEFLSESGIIFQKFDPKFSKHEAVVACFGSHFKIWQKIERPTLILEHDAILSDPESMIFFQNSFIHLFNEYPIVVNLGKPSFGKYLSKEKVGLYPSFSKNGKYFAGAHGYLISPAAAKIISDHARNVGALPTDLFFDATVFPFLFEFWPWPISCVDNFSSIQNVAGSIAKHSYNQNYNLV